MRKGIGAAGILFGTIFLLVGLSIGLVFGIIGGVFVSKAKENEESVEYFIKHGEKTKGIVTEADNGTTVEYEDDYGETYLRHYSVTSSEFYEGQKMVVYYDEDNPQFSIVPNIDVDFNTMFGSIFLFVGIGVGVVFGGIGIVAIIITIVALKKTKGMDNVNVHSSSNATANASTGTNTEYSFGTIGGTTPVTTNDIPVSVTINETPKGNLSGVDKNLL